MKENESQNTDTNAKPVDTSTRKEIEIEINGQKAWFDIDEYKAHQDFYNKKEKEYWEWYKEQSWYKEDSLGAMVAEIRLKELGG